MIKGHIIPGNLISSAWTSGPADTLSGEPVLLDVSDDGYKVNGAKVNVMVMDWIAMNGVLHVTKNVIIPPSHVQLVADFAAAEASAVMPAMPDGFTEELKAGSLWMRHEINVPEGTTEDACEGCTIPIEVVYEGVDSWVGIGFSENGLMLGGEAVM